MLISPASAVRELQPGLNHIHVIGQVIKRDHRGTVRILAFALYNKKYPGQAVGNSVESCRRIPKRRTLPLGTEICNMYFRFPLGQIATSGVVTSPVYYKLAVTGGTGYYANVGGQLEVITLKLKPLRQRMTFTLIGF